MEQFRLFNCLFKKKSLPYTQRFIIYLGQVVSPQLKTTGVSHQYTVCCGNKLNPQRLKQDSLTSHVSKGKWLNCLIISAKIKVTPTVLAGQRDLIFFSRG